jgi:hypothetical protein
VKVFKPLTGGLLVAFVLLLNAMAALPALHFLPAALLHQLFLPSCRPVSFG